jgi:hypothetical protein
MARLSTVFTAMVFVALLCSKTYGAELNLGSNNEIKEKQMGLVGKWKKVSTGKCDEAYPDEIEFFERPRYLGKKGPGQGFILWDAGGYKVMDNNQVKIEIATDEQVPYKFSISENILTFTDREGCEFRYRRVE